MIDHCLIITIFVISMGAAFELAHLQDSSLAFKVQAQELITKGRHHLGRAPRFNGKILCSHEQNRASCKSLSRKNSLVMWPKGELSYGDEE